MRHFFQHMFIRPGGVHCDESIGEQIGELNLVSIWLFMTSILLFVPDQLTDVVFAKHCFTYYGHYLKKLISL